MRRLLREIVLVTKFHVCITLGTRPEAIKLAQQKAEEIITPIEPTQDKVIIIEADETEKSFEIETPIVEDFELLENIEPIVEEKSVPGVEANIEQNEEIAESIEIKNNIENIAEKQPQELLVPSVAETATITNAEIDLIEEEKEEVIAPQKKIAEETQATNEEIFTTTEKIKEEKIDSLVDEHEQMFQNIKALLDSTTAEANADTGNAIVPIDPYHTIDYFASQGIHVDFDKNPDDKLGKNLKKFTQWLRHMKKLGPEDAIETNVEAEAEIQQIANSSNIMKEIVTEAMAQVLEKQGKKDKAIELYNKLSFLYPHKIPYFADQIKKLKGD